MPERRENMFRLHTLLFPMVFEWLILGVTVEALQISVELVVIH
jgi:hypothetical protein